MIAHWQLRSRELRFELGPALMGILNVTPDSFSDGGQFLDSQSAVDQALRMEDAGADILDLGGESTRPYSSPVAEDEELRRVVPVMEALQGRLQVPISIDTTKSRVARAAIDLGAEIINDVSGLEQDPEMLPLAAATGAGVCAMHMRGRPANMQDAPEYDDVVQEILDYLRLRDQQLQAGGVAASSICLDPGIGFGKTHQHNLQLLRSVHEFHQLGRPLLVGHSRKGFIGKLLGSAEDRDLGTVAVSLALAGRRVQVLRVHNVQAHRQALTCYQAALEDTA